MLSVCGIGRHSDRMGLAAGGGSSSTSATFDSNVNVGGDGFRTLEKASASSAPSDGA